MTQHRTYADPNLAYLAAQTTLPTVSVLAVRVAALVSTWATRKRTRLALSQLSAAQLADVGLTPDAARTESQKVFWRA